MEPPLEIYDEFSKIHCGTTSEFWDYYEYEASGGAIDIDNDLRSLLVSIERECRAIRSTASFRAKFSSSGGQIAHQQDSSRLITTRRYQHAGVGAVDLGSVLNQVEEKCLSLQRKKSKSQADGKVGVLIDQIKERYRSFQCSKSKQGTSRNIKNLPPPNR